MADFQPMSPPGPAAPPMAQAPNQAGDGLVLAGGIVAIVFTCIYALVGLNLLLSMVIFERMGGASPAPFGLGLIVAVLAVGLLLNVVGIVVTFSGRAMVRRGDAHRGWMRALTGGILLVLPNQVAGILVIVGAVQLRPSPTMASVGQSTA